MRTDRLYLRKLAAFVLAALAGPWGEQPKEEQPEAKEEEPEQPTEDKAEPEAEKTEGKS